MLCAGCNRHAADASRTQFAKPTPEERFQRVLESFRRKVEEPQIGFVVTENGTRSTMFGTNKVSSQLIPPATTEDHYTAVITVVRESHYSLRHTTSSSEESDHEQNATNQGSNLLDDPKTKKGIDILEPGLSGKGHSDGSPSAPKSEQSDDELVKRQPDKVTRKYDLTYEGDRWMLVTKPDPKTEQSIQFAFDQALASQ